MASILFAAPFAAKSQSPDARVFETIIVEGNDRFRDGDVLATSGLQTGTPVGQDDLVAAVEALDFTGEFEDVSIRSEGNTLIIFVEETAAYSGGLTFGAGYDSDNGVFGAAGFSLDNAFGFNSQIRANAFVADEIQTLKFIIQSSDFWSEGVRGGVRLNYANFEYDETTYNYENTSIEPFVVFDIDEKAVLELRYTFASDDISNVEEDASPIIQAEAGRETSSGVGFSIATGSRLIGQNDGFLDAWSFRFDQDFTGLDGDTRLSRTKIALFARKDLSASGVALRSRVELGAVVGRNGDDPRASDRFTLGGASLRGFERGAITPRDVCLGCAANGDDLVTNLGGNYYAVARTDLLVPIFKSRPSIETFAFVDVGTVWNLDTDVAAAGTVSGGGSTRSSTGIGASFDTEIGKFEAYVALATNGQDRDEEQNFGLTFRSDF
ncbi:MAG: BamA/TamA family outer membrane protein [Litoreibacter sp.]